MCIWSFGSEIIGGSYKNESQNFVDPGLVKP